MVDQGRVFTVLRCMVVSSPFVLGNGIVMIRIGTPARLTRLFNITDICLTLYLIFEIVIISYGTGSLYRRIWRMVRVPRGARSRCSSARRQASRRFRNRSTFSSFLGHKKFGLPPPRATLPVWGNPAAGHICL